MIIFNILMIFCFFSKSNTCHHFVGVDVDTNRIRQVFGRNLTIMTNCYFLPPLKTFELFFIS
jgi:hypothetical protein